MLRQVRGVSHDQVIALGKLLFGARQAFLFVSPVRKSNVQTRCRRHARISTCNRDGSLETSSRCELRVETLFYRVRVCDGTRFCAVADA